MDRGEPPMRRPGLGERMGNWFGRHRRCSVMIVAGLAVMINCYPVIFCGRSFVSPACGGPMVYSWWPPIPGTGPLPIISNHGSDVSATMLAEVPAGFIESRSLLQEGALPLWNRYNHAGAPFLGQAVTMLGDPLQLVVILGHGSAVAWDLKFLAAKFLFCAGFGLLIFRLLAAQWLALIYTALAAYCGAFFFINDHPVFFSFAYAPWILLSAMEMLDGTAKSPVRWGLVWLLANFGCFNGGHVEVAVVLIGGLNLAALAQALAGCHRARELGAVLGRMAGGTALFLCLTAPMWMSFLASLEGAYSVHSRVKVIQLPVRFLPGIFDDFFYYLLHPDLTYAALSPGGSLLLLAGSLLSMLCWRQVKGMTFFWVNGAAILWWGGCIYGWVPASLLETVPLLNRVGHNYVDFSYLLILHLTIQSAYGFKALAGEQAVKRQRLAVLGMVLGFAGLIAAYALGTVHQPIRWLYVLGAAGGAAGAPILYVWWKRGRARIPAWGWAAVLLLGFLPQARFGLYTFGNQNWLLIPGPREVLNAPSQSIGRIQDGTFGGASEPFRIAGLDESLRGDYAAVYGLEDIRSCAPLTSSNFIELAANFPGMNLLPGAWELTLTDPVAAQPLLNLLNVRYLLAPPHVQLEPGLDFRVREASDFGVLENLGVWPRAFFSGQVTTISTAEGFIRRLQAEGKRPFIAVTAEEIERHPGLRALAATTNAAICAATNYRLGCNSTSFDIHASGAGVVCLTEGQARDFLVRVNGAPREVLTVNRAFKGVQVDRAGDYHVEFIYRPRHWQLACVLFWGAAGVVAAIAAGRILACRIGRKR